MPQFNERRVIAQYDEQLNIEIYIYFYVFSGHKFPAEMSASSLYTNICFLKNI